MVLSFFVFPQWDFKRVERQNIPLKALKECNEINLNTRPAFREEENFCINKKDEIVFTLINDGDNKANEFLVNIIGEIETQTKPISKSLNKDQSRIKQVSYDPKRVGKIISIEIIPYIEYNEEIIRCSNSIYEYSNKVDNCISS